jgi:predicted RNA-binding Zn-ribbon protein involved in translation (DUF1610 family)
MRQKPLTKKQRYERMQRVMQTAPSVTCPKCGFEFIAVVWRCLRRPCHGECGQCGHPITLPPTKLIYVNPPAHFARRVQREL